MAIPLMQSTSPDRSRFKSPSFLLIIVNHLVSGSMSSLFGTGCSEGEFGEEVVHNDSKATLRQIQWTHKMTGKTDITRRSFEGKSMRPCIMLDQFIKCDYKIIPRFRFVLLNKQHFTYQGHVQLDLHAKHDPMSYKSRSAL